MSKRDLGYKHENHSFFFPEEEASLPFYSTPPSVILSSSVYFFLSCIYSFLSLRQSVCPRTPWRKQPRSILHFFLNLFYIYFYMCGWRRDGSRFIRQVSSTHPTTFVRFLFFPFQAYSSQYLPVLSKCYCKVFQ